jgi:acetyl-CoA acyltransferase
LYQGLLNKTAIDPKSLDYIVAGNVIQEVRTANIAREAAMAAGGADTARRYPPLLVCMSWETVVMWHV